MDEPVARRTLLAAAIPLCCETPPAPASSFRFEGNLLKVNRSLLSRPGTAVTIRDEARKLNLILFHPNRHEYYCLSRVCTHGGAMCAYNRWRHTVQCTSLNHAEYDFQGRLLHGRTHGDLRSFPVRLERQDLVIEL